MAANISAGLPARTTLPILTGMASFAVTLNGEHRRVSPPTSVAHLLTEIGLDTRKVAVERNEAIVPRSRYAETWLEDGDALEVVHFIGGG